MSACLFLITKTRKEKKGQDWKGFKAGAYLLNNSLQITTISPNTQFEHEEWEHSVARFTLLCEKGGTTSSSQYHWRSKPFILWLLLTLECMANYNSPSVGDCCKLRQDMKGLWGMAVPVMGRGQTEQPWGQHTSIISIVSLVRRQSKGSCPGIRGWYRQHREMKLTTVCIPEGDKDPVNLCCAVGHLFFLPPLSLSDSIAQNWYNPEG